MTKNYFIFLAIFVFCFNLAFGQTIKEKDLAELKATLLKVYESDQEGRKKQGILIQKGETNTQEYKDLLSSIKQQDAENLKIVLGILDKYGWLGMDDVGFEASQGLFLVIQHADLPTQEKYLPMIRKAAKEGKTLPSNLALLEDRVLMRQGKRQIYGSQVRIDAKTGNKFLYPLEDPDNVDERRKKVGLNPIAEYLSQSFQMKWDVEEYKRQLPEIEKSLFPKSPNSSPKTQTENENIITSDIDNFWTAYDAIITTKDNAKQLEFLNKLFIEKGSDGLKKIMQARRYTPQEYVDAINRYPKFWNSIRANTYKSKQLAGELQTGIEQLRKIYPNLKPSKIYFTIGVFRTNGTTLDGVVLIGSEMAMTDETTVMDEFPESFNYFKNFVKTTPIKNIGFGNVHEYIHTQQKTTIGNSLLAQSVLEGVAEFLAVKATNLPSTTPAISFGKQNFEKVRTTFAAQMFNSFTGFWLYSNADNEFKMRDLGYYVGYEICEKYYDKSADKNLAVKEMLELDYNNEAELLKFVDRSGYFAKSSKSLKKAFEKIRPKVIGITQFKNKSSNVTPTITEITIKFSAKMNTNYRNFELGPLGENNVLRLKKFVGWSADGKSLSFEIELKPNQRYQIIVGDQFRDENGISLKPYLIDFTTNNDNN